MYHKSKIEINNVLCLYLSFDEFAFVLLFLTQCDPFALLIPTCWYLEKKEALFILVGLMFSPCRVRKILFIIILSLCGRVQFGVAKVTQPQHKSNFRWNAIMTPTPNPTQPQCEPNRAAFLRRYRSSTKIPAEWVMTYVGKCLRPPIGDLETP